MINEKELNIAVSVVVPVFNEGENIRRLHESLSEVISKLNLKSEIIFVDDGSVDDSLEILKTLREKDQRVKLISLSRNFGHQIALTAGLDHAQGEAVVTLDADLQHPPELIEQLVSKWKEGFDVVTTRRQATEGTGLFKKIGSLIFYRLFKMISPTPIPTDSADFRLLSRRALDNLKNLRERDRFLRGLVSWIGFQQVSISYAAPARWKGRSQYSFLKMVRLAVDGITSFSSTPLYLAMVFGFIVSIASFLYVLVIIYLRCFTNRTIQGWSSLMSLVLFLGGVQLICLGIMGEYIGRIYNELKQRPLYLIKDQFGL